MALPETGILGLADIMAEFGFDADQEWSLSEDGAALINFTTGEEIAISDFYGVSAVPPAALGAISFSAPFENTSGATDNHLGEVNWVFTKNDPGESWVQASFRSTNKSSPNKGNRGTRPAENKDYATGGFGAFTDKDLANRAEASRIALAKQSELPSDKGTFPNVSPFTSYAGERYSYRNITDGSGMRITSTDPTSNYHYGGSRNKEKSTSADIKYFYRGAGPTTSGRAQFEQTIRMKTNGSCNGGPCYIFNGGQMLEVNHRTGISMSTAHGSDVNGSRSRCTLRSGFSGGILSDIEMSGVTFSIGPNGDNWIAFDNTGKMYVWEKESDGSFRYYKHGNLKDTNGNTVSGLIGWITFFKGYYYLFGSVTNNSAVWKTTDQSLKTDWELVDLENVGVSSDQKTQCREYWNSVNYQKTPIEPCVLQSEDILVCPTTKARNRSPVNVTGYIYTRDGINWGHQSLPKHPEGSRGSPTANVVGWSSVSANAGNYSQSELDRLAAINSHNKWWLESPDKWEPAAHPCKSLFI